MADTVRVSVNLKPGAKASLDSLMAAREEDMTGAVSFAVKLADHLTDRIAQGDRLALINADGVKEWITII